MTASRFAIVPIAIAACVALQALPAAAGEAAPRAEAAGQKLDSGLGELPHYRHWADPTGKAPLARTAVSGEKLDSGLGELPHYRDWADPAGRNVHRVASPAAGTAVARR